MGLLPGDRFPLRDLLYGLMLPSGNDAALAIGRHISGSDQAFVAQMNLLLARFGLTNSRFANPHGLGTDGHYTSAYDLAVLARYGMSLPGFKEIVTAPFWHTHGSRPLSFSNINSFLYTYRGADGIKTGYTRRAGPTLVASATRDGHRLYAVLLNAPSREWDATLLLNCTFANHVWAQ
jgi:D-alanyl-D-alanine carboxypeptidase